MSIGKANYSCGVAVIVTVNNNAIAQYTYWCLAIGHIECEEIRCYGTAEYKQSLGNRTRIVDDRHSSLGHGTTYCT